ncbi:unnamed protein product, partial [Mesorhabditis belari]|uniref:TRPM-like domain-containing protein n=1 Tax=Mesorhabditis belari TaxID=2138241 RepID=A0AAF3E8P7_9BILA
MDEDVEGERNRVDPLGLVFEMAPVLAHSGTPKIQLTPSLVLQTTQAIPAAVKHVYSRLAAAASEVDEGIASLLLILVSDGNTCSRSLTKSMEKAISELVAKTSLWLLSSGNAEEPLAQVASYAIRQVLPNLENESEVLHICVNSHSVVLEETARSITNPPVIVNAVLNTLLILCKETIEDAECARFRAQLAIRLAQPPPALLIGVPSESGVIPQAQLQSNAPILLSPSSDHRPLPVVFFAAESASSLQELIIYVEHGLPVIILQDSCELCDTLYNAFLLYKSAEFNHEKFMKWLEKKFGEENHQAELISRIFALALCNGELIEFISSDELATLPSRIVEAFVTTFTDNHDIQRTLQLAACLNLPSLLDTVDVNAIDEELMNSLLVASLSREDRVSFLAALLSRPDLISITEDLLLQILHSNEQQFFNTIILCQCLGRSSTLSEVDNSLCKDLDSLFTRLSHGTNGLFPHSLTPPLNGESAIQILALWCLFLNRPTQTKCLVAHTEQPLATALILSRIARSLSNEAYDWFFYAESMRSLSQDLSKSAEALLNSVHKKSSTRSYQVLCEPLEAFGNAPLTEIAFKADNRDFLAHESSQRWVYRLLYGNLQIRAGAFPSCFPKWIKLLFSALFIIFIRYWVALRPSSHLKEKKTISPTVALLDTMRSPRKTRAYSTNSMLSGSTVTMNVHTHAPLLYQNVHNGGVDSATPQSMVIPFTIEEMDTNTAVPRLPKRRKEKGHTKRRWKTPTLRTFYSTPIVKYWVSLTFRLIHIGLLSYSVLLPGCGSNLLDMIVWVWTLIAWIEQIYVVYSRSHSVPITEMPWRIFDLIITFGYLIGIFVFKLFGEQIFSYLMPISVYQSRVISAFFLLYFCYATLFTYIPLSELFGPLVIRVKLMLLRDFTNFLVMVALVMISSAFAVHSLLYPDMQLSLQSLLNSLNWAWLSIFTTDMSALQESEKCKKSFLGSPRSFCSSLGHHSDSSCPRQGLPGYIVIIEYFIVLKLILWPILFAFFTKTAKSVDEEADRIWKHQMYGLVTEFGIRPCLPPPFTPILLLFGGASTCMQRCATTATTEHPDMNGETELKRIKAQLRRMNLAVEYNRENALIQTIRKVQYESSSFQRLVLPENLKNWDTLFPSYNPPFYNKPTEEFAIFLQKYVEVPTRQYTAEMRRLWRSKQLNDSRIRLSAHGFPLNPSGRTGITGRGTHARFGPNAMTFYIIFHGNRGESRCLLENGALPHDWRYDCGARDDRLRALLVQIGINEGDAQVLSTRRIDPGLSTPSDTGPNSIYSALVSSASDTDNAWTEYDVWAVSLR